MTSKAQINITIPRHLKNQLKSALALKGWTLQTWFCSEIQQLLQESSGTDRQATEPAEMVSK